MTKWHQVKILKMTTEAYSYFDSKFQTVHDLPGLIGIPDKRTQAILDQK